MAVRKNFAMTPLHIQSRLDAFFNLEKNVHSKEKTRSLLEPMLISTMGIALSSGMAPEDFLRQSSDNGKCIAQMLVGILDADPSIDFLNSFVGCIRSYFSMFSLDTQIGESFDTLLQFAIAENRSEAVRILLEAGANPNAYNARHPDAAPLVLAAMLPFCEKNGTQSKIQSSNIVKMLLSHGAKGCFEGKTYETEKNIDNGFIVKTSVTDAPERNLLCVIEKCLATNTIYRQEKLSGDNPAFDEFTTSIEAIIDSGSADVNLADSLTGDTPLHAFLNPRRIDGKLCRGKRADSMTLAFERIVRKLLSSGANPNAKNNNGYTPLMYASMYDTDSFCRMILEMSDTKPDIDVNTAPEGKTALHIAAEHLRYRNVKALLEHKAKIISDALGNLPGQVLPKLVLSESEKDAEGYPPVNRTREDNWPRTSIFRRATKETYLDVKTEERANPDLGYPYAAAYREIVDMLVKNGLDINHVNDEGKTFFHSLCANTVIPDAMDKSSLYSLVRPLVEELRNAGGKTVATLPFLAEAVLKRDHVLCRYIFTRTDGTGIFDDNAGGTFPDINSEVRLPIVDWIYPKNEDNPKDDEKKGLYLFDYFRTWEHLPGMQWIDYLQFEKCELEMVKFLLDKGLDCTKTALPSSALFWCCMKNHGELVKLLYDNGARFMKVNSKGEQISEAVLLVENTKNDSIGPALKAIFRRMEKQISEGDRAAYLEGLDICRAIAARNKLNPVFAPTIAPFFKAVSKIDVVGEAVVTSSDFEPCGYDDVER